MISGEQAPQNSIVIVIIVLTLLTTLILLKRRLLCVNEKNTKYKLYTLSRRNKSNKYTKKDAIVSVLQCYTLNIHIIYEWMMRGNVHIHYILICHHSLVTLFLGTSFESTITIIIRGNTSLMRNVLSYQ